MCTAAIQQEKLLRYMFSVTFAARPIKNIGPIKNNYNIINIVQSVELLTFTT